MGAGPGLGLTIARGVVEAHGGRIWVESAGYDPEGLPGSTFCIALPLHLPADALSVAALESTVSLSLKRFRDATQADTGEQSEASPTLLRPPAGLRE